MNSVLGADPHIVFDSTSNNYYCYCTGGCDDGQFLIYKSKDLINWEFVGYALDTNINNWGKDWFWAPECYYNPHNKYYYLFYSALVKNEYVDEYFGESDYIESAKIGVAVSLSPEGPFINITNRPLDYYPYDKNYRDVDAICKNVFDKKFTYEDSLKAPFGAYLSSIDVNVFFENDRIYLYYSRCCYRNCTYDSSLKKFIEESNIVGVELNTDWWFNNGAPIMPTIKKQYIDFDEKHERRQDKFINIINYSSQPQEWENGHINDYENKGLKNRRWSEGSTTFKRTIEGKEVYCITYSCNNYLNALYGVGIAFADSPLTIFKKYKKNPIIHQNQENNLFSTGHGTIVEKDDRLFYFFHGRNGLNKNRILYIGEIHIESLDNIYIDNIVKCKLIKNTVK